MVYNKSMTDKILYQCPGCGLHYEDKQIVKQCAAFCTEHNGCSMEITQHSVERKNTAADPQSV